MAEEIVTTVAAVFHAQEALGRLLKERLPVKTAYHLSRLAKLITPELDLLNEQRDRLVKEYGTEVPGAPGTYTVPPDKVAEFNKHMNELGTLPVTLRYRPLAFEALDGLSVTGDDLLALGPLVAEPAEALASPAGKPAEEPAKAA